MLHGTTFSLKLMVNKFNNFKVVEPFFVVCSKNSPLCMFTAGRFLQVPVLVTLLLQFISSDNVQFAAIEARAKLALNSPNIF